ncbi:dsrm domain protein [Ceratobasidium sp. AG-Ba]|nr:dsrm domain protein [Ceratobasidium sp. AG-Ba]QRW12174.1 dsrm domain protein [Ceratobasidium sp. AG-Ba]
MTDSAFNRRAARYVFGQPSGSHTWTSLVQEWSDRARIPVQWQRYTKGAAHQLIYIEIPVIEGIPHPEYRGEGRSSQEAKSNASFAIAHSGHC